MAKVRRLLVPIDGSQHSLRALDLAIERAAVDPKIQLVLLNVQTPMPSGLFVTRSMIAEHQAAGGKAALARALQKLHRHSIKAETMVGVGEPGETIAKVARRRHCGEIVLGSRGLGSVKGLILGSVTTKVIHATRVPVTVVP
jgi:nucleotide-binding universal stress UspA family protein